MTSPASEVPPLVALVVVPPVESASHIVVSLDQHLKGWFRPTGVATTCRDARELAQPSVMQPTGYAGVRVWMLFGNSSGRNDVGSAHLYFAVERSANQELKFLWRSVELPSGLDEVGIEQLVQVIHLSSLALWEGSVETPREQVAENLARERGAILPDPPPIGPTAFERETPVNAPTAVTPYQPPAPPWRPPPLVRITHASVLVQDGEFAPVLGIGYLIRWRGPEQTAVGPEMMLGANFWFGRYALGVRATWQSLSTQEIALTPVQFDVSGNSFRLGGHATCKMARSIELTTELGGGLDIIRYRTLRTTDPQLEPEVEPHDLRPFIYFGAGAQRRIGPFRLGISTVLVAQILHTRYGVANSDSFTSYMTPWRVQPGLRFELSRQ